jgi:hypothetical protein
VAARYALVSFVTTIGGQAHLVQAGALRDSAHGAVTVNSGAFTTTPPVAGQTVSGVLAQYLAAYPAGP